MVAKSSWDVTMGMFKLQIREMVGRTEDTQQQRTVQVESNRNIRRADSGVCCRGGDIADLGSQLQEEGVRSFAK
jgi:hypothetical protein